MDAEEIIICEEGIYGWLERIIKEALREMEEIYFSK